MAIYYITELFPRRPAPEARTRKLLGFGVKATCFLTTVLGAYRRLRDQQSSVRAETVHVYLKVRAQIARVAGQPVVALALLL